MPRVYEILLFSTATLPPKKVMCPPSKHIISLFFSCHAYQEICIWPVCLPVGKKLALVKNFMLYQKQDPGGRIILRATWYNVAIPLVNVSMLVHIRSVVLLLHKYLLWGSGRNPGIWLSRMPTAESHLSWLQQGSFVLEENFVTRLSWLQGMFPAKRSIAMNAGGK